MYQAHQPRTERKRTFTGCRTCRNRHVKCDDAHPECGPCRQMGLACGGYWAPLLWITEGMTSQPKERQGRRGFEYRYPVLSDAQRRQMSGEISQSLGRRSASEHIARLEASSCRLQNRGGAIPDLFRGPFGVFRVHQQEPYAAPSSPKPNDLVNVDLQPGQDKESNAVEQSTHWWESRCSNLEIPTDDPTRGYNEPPEKDGKFCLAEECYDIGLDPSEQKTPDVGFTDIHLQVQGQWNKTLFPSIYGFPESLWTLLSQTVATVNEKARIESLDPPNRALTDALTHHIQNLEQTIWAWTLTSDLIGPPRPDHRGSSENQDPLAESLAQGLHQALILYFYRRMFNSSPMLLQDVVGRALDHLERCVTRVNDQELGMCIAWATLTTACEAMTPALQEKALKISSVTDEQENIITKRPAKEVVTKLWEQRRVSGDQSLCWRRYLA
ncbi:arg81-transcription factor involved in arginine metabolism [Fusarium albosuccineum]|uniref:Arg81-transcription factor involved in arginine metabolism n=1 Tax=Fusarium albosuccineum TaxID=1237068 RepID=A0A8H4LID1_9HYPO|nr:arg81-transcription factor involved in arginine metabolism [Fusarium albosuccineum]